MARKGKKNADEKIPQKKRCGNTLRASKTPCEEARLVERRHA